jgi:hypothetical protein
VRPQIPEGASVKVTHLRTVQPYLPGLWPSYRFTKYNQQSPLKVGPAPKGGRTEARISLPDGRVAEGVAECSMSDTFCKRIGRDIAVGRALKELRAG